MVYLESNRTESRIYCDWIPVNSCNMATAVIHYGHAKIGKIEASKWQPPKPVGDFTLPTSTYYIQSVSGYEIRGVAKHLAKPNVCITLLSWQSRIFRNPEFKDLVRNTEATISPKLRWYDVLSSTAPSPAVGSDGVTGSGAQKDGAFLGFRLHKNTLFNSTASLPPQPACHVSSVRLVSAMWGATLASVPLQDK